MTQNEWNNYLTSRLSADTAVGLSDSINTDLLQSKSERLNKALQDKVAKLGMFKTDSTYTPDVLLGMNDADSPVTQNLQNTRDIDPMGNRYDAVEIRHGNNPYDMQGVANKQANDYSKSEYSMKMQREQVAKIFNKPVELVTEQDMLDVGNQQQIQKLADLARTEGEERWTAPLIQGSEQVNLTGKYTDEFGNQVNVPLNIPITSKEFGDVGKISGAAFGNYAGEAVTANAAIDPLQNAFAGPAQSGDLAQYISQLAKESPNEGGLGNAVAGFGYMLGEGVASTLDLVPEVAQYAYGNLVGDGKKWSDSKGLYDEKEAKQFKEWTGYNDQILSTLGQEASLAAKNAVEKGNYWELAEVVGKGIMTPELWGVSTGFIGGMILPGTAGKRVVDVATGVNKAAKAIMAADTTGKLTKAEAMVQAGDEAGAGYKIASILAGNTGYVGAAEGFARDAEALHLETYKEEMPTAQRIVLRPIGLLWAKMDPAVAKALVLGKDPVAKAIPELIKVLPDQMKATLIGKVAVMSGVTAARAAGAFGLEFLTEGVQTSMEQVAGKYKEGTAGVGDVLESSKYDIAGGALLGGSGGIQFAAPSIAVDVAKGISPSAIIDYAKSGVEKMTETPEQKVMRENFEYSAPLKAEAETALATGAADEVVSRVEAIHGRVSKDLDESAPKEFTYGIVIRNALNKANADGDAEAVKNIYKTIGELDAREDVDFKASSVISDRTYEATKAFIKMVNESTETANDKMDLLKAAKASADEAADTVVKTGTRIDANILAKVAALKASIEQEQTAMKDVMGSDSYEEDIKASQELVKLMTDYMNGKDLDTVNAELSTLGYLQLDPTSGEIKADPSRPGLVSYAKELTADLLNPAANANLLDKKVTIGKSVTLTGLQGFANSRLTKLFKSKEGTAYQTNKMINSLLPENEEMIAVIKKLQEVNNGLKGLKAETKAKYTTLLDDALNKAQEANEVLVRRQKALEAAGKPTEKGQYAFQIDNKGNETIQLVNYDENKKAVKVEMAKVNEDGTLEWINGKPVAETTVAKPVEAKATPDEVVYKEEYKAKAKFKEDEVVETAKPVEPTIVEETKEVEPETKAVPEYKPNNEDYHNAAKFAKEPELEAEVKPKARVNSIQQVRDTIAKLDAELAAELEGVQDMDMKAHVKAHYKKKLEEIQAERGKLDKMMDIVELAVDKKLDENAAKKVNAVLAFASKIVKDLLNRLGQLRTKLRLNRDQHKAIVAEMNNLLDAIAQVEKEYLDTNKIAPVEVKTAIGKVTKYEDSVYGPMVEAGDKRVAADKKLKSGKPDMYNAMEVIKAEKIAELDVEIAETGSLGAILLKRNLERYGLGTVINRILERSKDSIFGKMNANMFSNPEELIANLPKGFKDVFLAEGNKEDKDLLIEHFSTMDKYLKSVKIGDIKMNPKASVMGKTQGKSHIDINGLIMKNAVKESDGTVHNFPVDIIELIGTVKDGKLELDEQTETILKFYTAKMAVDTQAMIGNILSMDETEMGKYLGITDPVEQMQVKQDAAKGFINSATVRKDIGSEVYRALGLRFDNKTPEFTEESFESALGVLVQAIALDSGVMNGDKSARGNKHQNLIQVNKKVVESDAMLGEKGYEKLIKAMNKLQYLNESRNRPLPTFKQPEPMASGKRLVMNTRIAIDDETNKKMNKTEQIGYKISDRLAKYLKMDEVKVLKAMGYVEIEGSGLHVSEHSAQLARNDKLIREWDILKVFAKSAKDRMFYVPWGQTVSGRYTMLSDIQYQESKLHREFVVAENSTEEVDVHDKDNRQMLEASIMQGLDMDPDKLSPETATINFNKLFKITDEGITVEPEIKDGKPNATHVAIQKAYESMKDKKLNVSAMAEVFAESEGHHGISSIELLVEWDKAIRGNGVLTTHANLEIDAITSGMILTLLQIGSDEAIRMAEKGGIYSADRIEDLTKYVHKWLGKKTTFTPGALIEAGKKHAAEIEAKMAEAKKSGDRTELAKLRKELEQDSVFKDLYSTIGVGMIGEVTAYKEMLEKKEKRNASEEMQLAMLNEIGELNLKNIRSIAKSPVMVYIYGASVGSIKNKLTYSLGVDTVVKAIKKLAKLEAKTDRTAEDNAEMSQKAKFVNMFLPVESARKYVDMFGQPAERNWLNVEINEETIEKIGKVINATFGNAIETAFEKRLGFVNKNRDAVKAVEMLSFEAYKVRLTDAVTKALDTKYGKGKHNGESYKLSKSELVEINAELTEKGYGHTIVWKDADRVRNQSLQKTATKGGKHSMTVEIGDKSITGQVKESKAVANTGAASTIPIHAIDGDMILEVLNRELKGKLKGKYTGGNVYDAVVLGINKALLTDTADSYNTGMIEKGFGRSIMADQLEKLEAMISGLVADGLIDQYKAAIGLRPEGDSRDDYTKEMNRLKLSLSKSLDRIEDAVELNKERLENSAKAYGSGHLYQMGSGVVDVKATNPRARAMPAIARLRGMINQVIEADRVVTAKEFKGRIEPGVDYVLDLNDFVKGVNGTKSKANVVQIKVVDKKSEDYSTGLTTTKKVLELTDKLWESMNKRDTVQILGDADAILEQLNKVEHGNNASYWLNRVIKEIKDSGAKVIESTKPTEAEAKPKKAKMTTNEINEMALKCAK